MDALDCFPEIWCVDFEFHAPDGHRPEPLCVVAREFRSGRVVRLWLPHNPPATPPYPTGPDVLFVAFVASAELGCHLALNWRLPARVLDLHAEFRNLTNGRPVPHGRGLLGAMTHFGLDALDATEKEEWRSIAIRGGPFSDAERAGLIDYCETDVNALAKLLPRMLPHLDIPRAVGVRGRYMRAAARMEWNGTPIDTDTLDHLRAHWVPIKGQLVREVDRQYHVFVPTGRHLDPNTRRGAEILATAKDSGIDPYILADGVDMVWQEERDRHGETADAIRQARQMTGLSVAVMRRLVDNGQDHASVRGLDAAAREVAGTFPELGIGRGYVGTTGDDSDDNAARLFERLREPDPRPRPKHELVQVAANRIAGDGTGNVGEYTGPLTFSGARWSGYLAKKGIPWPRLPSGALALDDDTFKDMAKAFPAEIGPMRELRHSLGQMRLNELAVGPDRRNRTVLWAFSSTTGRNQPSNSKFIFGPSCWLRSLIRPEPGRALAYVDWSQQELAIAAALSRDPKMMEAYTSGDFYLSFAKMAGAVPPNGTKQTHARERDQFKAISLGVLYGLSAFGLARNLGVPHYHGRELLTLHQRTFRRFWEWSDAIEERAILKGKLRTVFGWTVRVGADVNPRSLRNFPMQGNGAEMMRLAACLATERGIRVCCPVHDAFLIEADADEIETETERMQDAMREASVLVLPGFPLKTDAKIVRHTDRYSDRRGERMWGAVRQILGKLNDSGIDL